MDLFVALSDLGITCVHSCAIGDAQGKMRSRDGCPALRKEKGKSKLGRDPLRREAGLRWRR